VWSDINILDDKEAQEVYTLLKENYVEDEDNMFRFDYSIEFLRWILCPPTYLPKWHFGVWSETDNKLLAFISGIPVEVKVKGTHIKMAEINYLCVHKKLRTKRMAPVLIKEVTRRVNLKGVYQAVYTAGVEIPKPICSAWYYHRNINYKKLVEVKFTGIKAGLSMSG